MFSVTGSYYGGTSFEGRVSDSPMAPVLETGLGRVQERVRVMVRALGNHLRDRTIHAISFASGEGASRSCPLNCMSMSRPCRVCGAPYLGGRVCSRVVCPRNGRRQRDLAWQPEEFATQGPEPVPPPDQQGPSLHQLLAELRGLLHEVVETACLIAQRHGVAALRREVPTLERVVHVFGGRWIRWGREVA